MWGNCYVCHPHHANVSGLDRPRAALKGNRPMGRDDDTWYHDWREFTPLKRKPRLRARLIPQGKKREKRPDLFAHREPQLDIREETGASIKTKIKNAIIANPTIT